MASFDDLMNGPIKNEFGSAWGEIDTQLKSENPVLGSAYDYVKQQAQDQLALAYSQLTENQTGVLGADALRYAKDFTMMAKTVSGAVQTINGLISAANAATTPAATVQAINMMMSTMLAVVTAAGVSSGYGALVAAAVAVLLEVLQAAGVFGNNYTFVASQCGANLTFTPTIVVGCAGSSNGEINANNASSWRHFPDGSSPWFTAHKITANGRDEGSSSNYFQWTDSTWFAIFQTDPNRPYAFDGYDYYQNVRPIDRAFSQYWMLEQGLTRALPSGAPAALNDFRRVFFLAWKGNAEFGFNGLKMQPDWAVLVHVVRVWNAAHSDSSYFDVGPGDLWDPSYTGVTDIVHNLSSTDAVYAVVNNKLRINMGPQYNVPIAKAVKVVSLKLPPSTKSLASTASTTSTPPSTATKVVVGIAIAAGAGAAGLGVWSYLTHQSFFGVVKGLFGKAVATVNPLPDVALETMQSTKVQTLLFPRPKFSGQRALEWAASHGYKARKVDFKPNYVHVRQRPPSAFVKGSLRTVELGDSGIHAIVGHLR